MDQGHGRYKISFILLSDSTTYIWYWETDRTNYCLSGWVGGWGGRRVRRVVPLVGQVGSCCCYNCRALSNCSLLLRAERENAARCDNWWELLTVAGWCLEGRRNQLTIVRGSTNHLWQICKHTWWSNRSFISKLWFSIDSPADWLALIILYSFTNVALEIYGIIP